MPFRLAVLERIAGESCNEAKLAFIHLLNEEGDRARAIADAEIKADADGEARRLDLRMAGTRARASLLQETIAADTMGDVRQSKGLRHASWRFTITTVAPVIFAILVTVFMFLF